MYLLKTPPPRPSSKKEVTTTEEPLKCLNFVCIQTPPPSSLDSCFITVCLRALCVKHCTHTAVMTKRPPHTWKKSFVFALHSWVHFCVRLLFDLYQIHPRPDYQIFFVISSHVNKIERPTSYNIYVGISFTMLINAPLVINYF